MLTLWIPDDATPEERAVYERIYNALPGTVNREPIGWRELYFVTFTATDEGKLEVVGCSE